MTYLEHLDRKTEHGIDESIKQYNKNPIQIKLRLHNEQDDSA